MQRTLSRLVVFLLVFCLAAGGLTALAAGRQAPSGLYTVLTPAHRAALVNATKAFMRKSFPVNGVRQAQLLPTRKSGAKAALRSISLAPMPSVLGLTNEEGYTNPWSTAHPILLATKPGGLEGYYGDWGFKLEPAGVAHIEYIDLDDDHPQYPFLVADKLGTTKMTVTIGGKSASKKITVKQTVPISSLTIYEYAEDGENATLTKLTSRTAATDSHIHLFVVASPSSATYAGIGSPGPLFAANYASKNEAVATVDAAIPGYLSDVYVKQPGSTVITVSATDGGKAKASFKLTVKGRLIDSVWMPDEFSMQPGTVQWFPYYYEPYYAWNPAYTWTVGNKKVASIDRYDRITALAPGQTKVTWNYKPRNLTASSSVTATYDKSRTGTDYYFYGVANSDYEEEDWDLPACAGDIKLMRAAFKGAGVPDANIHTYENLTGDEIRQMLWDIDPNYDLGPEDVVVFYFSGHGRGSYDQYERGGLVGVDFYDASVDDVQYALQNLNCTVVVILDSCLAGQFITAKGTSPAERLSQAKAFNQSWVSAISESNAASVKKRKMGSKAVTDSWYAQGQFRLLVACAPLEVCWVDPIGENFGWFTYWLARGFGLNADRMSGSVGTFSKNNMPADAGGVSAGAITLTEAYNYVKARIAGEADLYVRQTTSIWPAGNMTAVINTVE